MNNICILCDELMELKDHFRYYCNLCNSITLYCLACNKKLDILLVCSFFRCYNCKKLVRTTKVEAVNPANQNNDVYRNLFKNNQNEQNNFINFFGLNNINENQNGNQKFTQYSVFDQNRQSFSTIQENPRNFWMNNPDNVAKGCVIIKKGNYPYTEENISPNLINNMNYGVDSGFNNIQNQSNRFQGSSFETYDNSLADNRTIIMPNINNIEDDISKISINNNFTDNRMIIQNDNNDNKYDLLKNKSFLKKLTEEAQSQNIIYNSKKKVEFNLNPDAFNTPINSKTKSVYESYNKTDSKGKSSKISNFQTQSNIKQGNRSFIEN